MLLLHLTGIDEAAWQKRFAEALEGVEVVTRADRYDPTDIDYVFVWKPAPDAFVGLDGLKLVLSLGAGVDALLAHPALPPVPVARFVDADLTQRMSDYVIAQVTMHQRLGSRFAADQKARRWTQVYPPAASQTHVGIMGLGVLGSDAARKLLALGFSVRGWSRTEKHLPGIAPFVGPEAFDAFLSGTDILVNLLPLTGETQGILNYETFGKLRRDGLDGGPVIVNAGRGKHQREADIARALGDGTLGAASLDVFEVEPLPPESPLWDIKTCYITPHIAAISDVDAGVAYFSKVIADHRAGKALANLVDRSRGY